MILIAESGSTKTDWRLIHKNGELSSYNTIGFNPYYITESEVLEELNNSELTEFKTEIFQVYFYGAGCASEENCKLISTAFSYFFTAAQIEVSNDMLAAARATCGNEKGLVAILGTGSNSCLYDGVAIVENVTSLGYILGDYGSGADIGKTLIRAFLEKELPKDIELAFKKEFDLSAKDIINTIYKKPLPNRFLASFNLFIAKHINDPYIKQIVEKSLDQFFEKNICKYSDYQQNQLHMVGSIAFVYHEIISQKAKKYNIEIGKVIKAPIDELVKYHLK
jgi:N-acetylglucosamine kinase-like BadF-type ATPase